MNSKKMVLIAGLMSLVSFGVVLCDDGVFRKLNNEEILKQLALEKCMENRIENIFGLKQDLKSANLALQRCKNMLDACISSGSLNCSYEHSRFIDQRRVYVDIKAALHLQQFLLQQEQEEYEQLPHPLSTDRYCLE